jgi:hypothetical protein
LEFGLSPKPPLLRQTPAYLAFIGFHPFLIVVYLVMAQLFRSCSLNISS